MAELLTIPLKKSSDVDLVKPLRNLIQATYSGADGADECCEAVEELARLRAQAIWKLFDKSSLDVIYNYYDQLVSLESKIPPQEVAVPFKWKDAFDRGSIFGGRMSLTVSSLAFERVCVAFNIAALQSAGAAQQPLDTEDSLKLAAKLCQQAAGVLSQLKGSVLLAVHGEPTPDLQPDTLHALSQLMLAQAQELIAYKCIRDGMKESMVAKVCAAGEELYTEALRALQREPQRSLWEREWLPTVAAKQQAARGLANLYQGMVMAAAGRHGERIARLSAAAEALRGAAGAGGRLATVAPLSEAAARAARLLADATKDNDFIYHDRIPDAASLEPIQRAVVAKPLPPPDKWTDHRDVFASLVPLRLGAALQAAAARRGDAVHGQVAALRDATQLLNSILASLSLPACVEAATDGGGGAGAALPASVRERAASVRATGGLPALQRLMAELPELLQRNRDILTEAERMLREEAESDAALRAQFGARWSRTESDKLTEAFRANAAKYAQIIDNAVRADSIVQDKFRTHKDKIELLSRSEGEVSAGVPEAEEGSARVGGAEGEAAAALRRMMRDVDQLKAERDQLERDLQEVKVDLRERLEAATAGGGQSVDEAAVAAAAIGEALRPLQARVAASLQRQEALVAEIQAGHSALVEARGGGGAGRVARDAALGALTAAADAYTELSNNLTEGVKFYNDLTQLLVAFQNKVSDFCFARKTEKEELLKDLTQEASRGAPPPPAARPADEPAATRREAPPRPAPPAPAQSALPYPTQPQGMPLPYGAAAAPYPYYAAPMPTLYNPYATLPYPHHARLPPSQPYQPYQHPPAPQQYPPPPAGYNPYPPQ